MYDKKEKIETTNQLRKDYAPNYGNGGAGDAKNRETAATEWNGLYTAKTAKERYEHAQAVLSLMPEIEFIDISVPGRVGVKYGVDSEGKDLNQLSRMGDNAFVMADNEGKGINIRSWATAGGEIHGERDANKAMKAGGGSGTYTNIPADQLKGMIVRRKGKPDEVTPQTADQAFTSYIDRNTINNDIEFSKTLKGKKQYTRDDVAKELNKSLVGIGFKAIPSGGYKNAEVFIKVGTNESPNFDFSAKNFNTSLKSMKDWIKSNTPGGTPEGKKKYIEDLMDKGITGSQELGDYSKYNEINK